MQSNSMMFTQSSFPDLDSVELEKLKSNWLRCSATMGSFLRSIQTENMQLPDPVFLYIRQINENLLSLSGLVEKAGILVPSETPLGDLFPISAIPALPASCLTPSSTERGGSSSGSDQEEAICLHSPSKSAEIGRTEFKENFHHPEVASTGALKRRSLLELVEKPNEGILCQMGYVESQARFFVSVDREAKKYFQMEEKLQKVAEVMKREEFTFLEMIYKSEKEKHLQLKEEMKNSFQLTAQETDSLGTSPWHSFIEHPCIARYHVDQMWYRAEILKVVTEGCYVHFIDFGNSSVVHLANILPLPVNFASLPAGAFECHLLGVDATELNHFLKADYPQGRRVTVVPVSERKDATTNQVSCEVALPHMKDTGYS